MRVERSLGRTAGVRDSSSKLTIFKLNSRCEIICEYRLNH
jgi:hypothetical protein